MPETVTRRRRDCDLNPGRTAPESSTPSPRLPSHHPHAVALHVSRYSASMRCVFAELDPFRSTPTAPQCRPGAGGRRVPGTSSVLYIDGGAPSGVSPPPPPPPPAVRSAIRHVRCERQSSRRELSVSLAWDNGFQSDVIIRPTPRARAGSLSLCRTLDDLDPAMSHHHGRRASSTARCPA